MNTSKTQKPKEKSHKFGHGVVLTNTTGTGLQLRVGDDKFHTPTKAELEHATQLLEGGR